MTALAQLSQEATDALLASLKDTLRLRDERIAGLEIIIYEQAHIAATLGSGSTGWLRGRFMSISNALNASIGRAQSSHGDQFPTVQRG